MKRINKIATGLGLVATLATSLVSQGGVLSNKTLISENIQKQTYEQPVRTMEIISENPTITSEANTRTWYSLNQATGKVIDYIAKKNDLDKTSADRIYQTLTTMYIDYAFGFYSHELAHDRVERKGGKISEKLDFSDWSKGIPKWIHSMKYTPSYNLHNKEMLAGLNQDILNAKYMHLETKDKISFDNGLSFLIGQIEPLRYNAISKDGNGNHWEQNEYNHSDISAFSEILLKQKGIKFTQKEQAITDVFAIFASTKTYDATRAIKNFILYGNRTTETTKIDFLEYKIIPPLFSAFRTPDGMFMDSTTIIQGNKNSLEISLGHDLDGVFGGKVNTSRIGLKLNLDFNKFGVSPFAYLDSKKDYNVGLEATVNLTTNIAAIGKLELSENDILENSIKGKENGFHGWIGTRIRLNLD